jgi:hypothetical protein
VLLYISTNDATEIQIQSSVSLRESSKNIAEVIIKSSLELDSSQGSEGSGGLWLAL